MTGFEEVYAVYFDDVYRFLLSLCGSESTAEELTSETFFRAMSALGRFRRLLPLEEAGLACESCEAAVEDRSEAARIQALLHGLREPYKEVFMWRVYGEKSFREIAELFGKTENWACVTYHRARKMIREGLEE